MGDIRERSHRQYPHDMVLAAVWEQGYLTALADLRGKMDGLRGPNPCGEYPEALGDVLALLDEAQP